jgi:rSAM/selenodomain-associated transferase 2
MTSVHSIVGAGLGIAFAGLVVFALYLGWAALTGQAIYHGRRRHSSEPARPRLKTLSVVIPTLNEAEELADTVRRAQQVPEVVEIIVVDGGSTDATVALALDLGCCVLSSPRGRGQQMRTGAVAAKGDVVVLLHADTWLPARAGAAVLQSLHDESVVGGGFWKIFRQRHPLMLGSRFRCALRLCLAGRVLGDQAMFIRRDVLETIGGVPDMPLMEEFELCRRLRAVGRLALAGATVTTSMRRFAKRGILPTYFLMWRVTMLYYLGTPADKLKQLYEKEPRQKS